MAAGERSAKEDTMSFLGIDGHEHGTITTGALYGRGAAAVLAAERAPARSAVETPGEEPAAKQPPSAAGLRAFSDSPLAGPPRRWSYAGEPLAGPLQPRTASPGPVAQSVGGDLFGQLGDLVRCKGSEYLTEREFAAAKAKILGIGGP